MKKQESLSSYENGCNALATAFMHHIHDDLDDDYKLGDLNDEYFIGSDSTDYANFADGSCYYLWDCPTMYLALKNSIPYEVMIEHADWHDDYVKPEWWVKLEIYSYKQKYHTEMSAKDFQRMLQREYFENRAKHLSDEVKQRNDAYMKKSMEKFKKDFAEMKI